MVRQANVSVQNNFIRGLITEATELNFPQNACTSTENCVFEQKGTVRRRLGFEFEENHTTQVINRQDSVIKSFLWKDVLGDGTQTFVVVQDGNTLRFYDTKGGVTDAISDSLLLDTVDLTTFSPAGSEEPKTNECEFAEGLGFLFVTHPNLEPFYVQYNASTTLFTETQITIQERDFEGLDDTFEISFRPTGTYASQSANYRYNMDNQGWYFDNRSAIASWDTARTDLPSSSDIWWFFKNANDDFDTTLIDKRVLGNTRAPKGHFLLNVFNKDRSTESGIAGITTESTGANRFSTNAFFAGRVWYSGLQSGANSSKLWFSQIIENDRQIGRCYQANDPTSEQTFDLLDSDGGVIQIPDAGNIIKLFALRSALLVFSANGIWAISGSTNNFGQSTAFKATDFVVSKISSIPTLSATSFVDVEGFPVWWNSDGIYTLTEGQAGGFQVNSLTDDTIREFFLAIPLFSKQRARGAYNSIEKKVHWLYRTTQALDALESHNFDGVLTFNTITAAFSPWVLNQSNQVQLNDVLVLEVPTSPFTTELVTDNSLAQVTNNAGDPVIITVAGNLIQTPVFKYLVSYLDGNDHRLTFAEERDVSYKDWSQLEAGVGIDYSSFFKTGYLLDGQALRFFQPNYVIVFLETELLSSCLMQGVFDYSSSGASGKESVRQQIYNSSTQNKDVNFRRLKIRGKGRSLQLNFESTEGDPFNIIGWSLYNTQNAGI